jgi:hypothetical protein
MRDTKKVINPALDKIQPHAKHMQIKAHLLTLKYRHVACMRII